MIFLPHIFVATFNTSCLSYEQIHHWKGYRYFSFILHQQQLYIYKQDDLVVEGCTAFASGWTGTFNSGAVLGFTQCAQVKVNKVPTRRPGHDRFYPVHKLFLSLSFDGM